MVLAMNDISLAMSVATENIAMEVARKRITKKKIAEKCGLSVNTVSSISNDIEGKNGTMVQNLLAIWIIGLDKPAEELFVRRG